MSWLTNNLGTILVAGAILLVIAGAILLLVRDKKKGKCSCGCNCSSCAIKGSCHKS